MSSITSAETSAFVTTVLGTVEFQVIFLARRPVKNMPVAYSFVLCFASTRMLTIVQ